MQSARKLETLQYKDEKEGFLTKIKQLKVGVIPLPLYLVLAAIVYGASVYNQLPTDFYLKS